MKALLSRIYTFALHEEPLAVGTALTAIGDLIAEQPSWRQVAIVAVGAVLRQFVSPAQAKAAVAVVDAAAPVLPADARLTALEDTVKQLAARIGA